MRKRNAKCDYIPSRDEELRQVFLNRLGKGNLNVTEIFDSIVSDSRASRFYISEERAYRIIKRFREEGCPSGHKKLNTKMRMLIEINSRVDSLMAADPSLTLKEAVFEAVNSAAPSFYLTFHSVKSIIYRTLRNRRA